MPRGDQGAVRQVVVRDVVDVAGVRPRDHQRVAAGGRVDVHDRDRPLVLVDADRGQLAGHDLAEDAVVHCGGCYASCGILPLGSLPWTPTSAHPWCRTASSRSAGLVTARFLLEPLGPQHNDSDYDAWTSSMEHIQGHARVPRRQVAAPDGARARTGPIWSGTRATSSSRKGFTYTVRDPRSRDVVGCLTSTGRSPRSMTPTCACGCEPPGRSWTGRCGRRCRRGSIASGRSPRRTSRGGCE